ACAAAGLRKSADELSALARIGSGSASRSVPGGWAVWEDESARQVFPPSHWDLRFCIAVCSSGPKQVGSRDGMRATRETSPYHAAWIAQCRRDLPEALRLLAARDLSGLGALAERNALRMHADALAADPPLLYWQPPTVACLHATAARSGRGLRIVHAPTGVAWYGGAPPPELRFAARAAELALRFCGGGGDLSIVFEDDLALEGRKLGLGGSAAASVLAVRAACATSARAVGEDEVVSLALAAHRAEQGGSG